MKFYWEILNKCFFFEISRAKIKMGIVNIKISQKIFLNFVQWLRYSLGNTDTLLKSDEAARAAAIK